MQPNAGAEDHPWRRWRSRRSGEGARGCGDRAGGGRGGPGPHVPGALLCEHDRPVPRRGRRVEAQLEARHPLAAKILGDHQSYTVHPGAGTVTFRPSSPSQEPLLLTSRCSCRTTPRCEGGRTFKVLPIAAACLVSPQLGGAQAPCRRATRSWWCPSSTSALEMARLRAFRADNTVRADEVRNLAVLAGNQKELRHLMDVDRFRRRPARGFSIGIFPALRRRGSWPTSTRSSARRARARPRAGPSSRSSD
jgi:hypothetical protein